MDQHTEMNSKRSVSWRMRIGQAQSGQAIVLMALAMVGLIGMLGLAIDGGGMFFLQRDAQNATDAAVLAATYALCAGGDQTSVENAGYEAAAANGFRNEGDRTVTVSNPPLHGEKADAPDANNYVEVNITANKPPYFIQVVYQGALQITTRAIGSCTPPFDASKVGAIFATGDCQNTVNWQGSSGYIEGGIFSNYEIKIGGGGNGNTVIGGAEAGSTVSPADNSGNTYFSPLPVFPTDTKDDPFASISDYLFNAYKPDGNVVSALMEALPDTYLYTAILADNPDIKQNGVWAPKNHDGALKPNGTLQNGHYPPLEGLYYVEGDVDLGNNGASNVIGRQGATFVATGVIKGSDVKGLHYYAYPGSTGLVLYSNVAADCNGNDSNGIKVSGNSTTWYGIIYAPYSGADVSGSGLTLFGSIVGQSVSTSGSDLRLVADPTLIPPRPAIVQIAE